MAYEPELVAVNFDSLREPSEAFRQFYAVSFEQVALDALVGPYHDVLAITNHIPNNRFTLRRFTLSSRPVQTGRAIETALSVPEICEFEGVHLFHGGDLEECGIVAKTGAMVVYTANEQKEFNPKQNLGVIEVQHTKQALQFIKDESKRHTV